MVIDPLAASHDHDHSASDTIKTKDARRDVLMTLSPIQKRFRYAMLGRCR
jgi:hypothetical protein